jgi:hypothetical protein
MARWIVGGLLAVLMSIDCARADDITYPGYRKHVEAPVSEVAPLASADESSAAPGCVSANETCDDPAPLAGALAVEEE